MIRRLSREEREIWGRLRRSVRPLRMREAEPEPDSEAAPDEAPAGEQAMPTGAAPARSPQPVRRAPPLVGFDQRARRRVLSGRAEIDGRLDLHGLRQDEAFDVLTRFLQAAQGRGARLVLVITGKGREGDGERGILHRHVPAWLARPDLRGVVLGFETAGRPHGGGGALYVRLRRRRSR